VAAGDSTRFNHHAWGWGGDTLWLLLLVGVFWGCAALWWH